MSAGFKQHPAAREANRFRLLPPLAEDFWVYGGDETAERARQWALNWHYLLADGIPSCAHGLYMMPTCPGGSECKGRFRQLDHARIWVPASAPDGRPFILAHPYAKALTPETRLYAAAHQLDIASETHLGDDWYGSGTIPVRLTVPTDWPLWPIEAAALVALGSQPIRWPEDRS